MAPLTALSVGLFAGPQPLDDAFITLRYARSIAEGNGFVFNIGEHVLGTTTPLFALVLAVLHRLTSVDLVWLAYGLALAAHVGTVVLIGIIGRSCAAPVAGAIAGMLYALAPMVVSATVGCMEASLFTFASLYSLAPSRRAPSVWRAVAAAAAALLRPEGVLAVGVYLLRATRINLRFALRSTAVIAGGILPWVVFATWYFGSPLPQSLIAKWNIHTAVGGLAPEMIWNLLVSVPIALPAPSWVPFAPAPFGTMVAHNLTFPADPEIRRIVALAIGTLTLLTACIGAIVLYRRNPATVWVLLFTASFGAAYATARPAIFPWYLIPLLPILLLTFVVGGSFTLRTVLRRPWFETVAAAAGLVLIGVAAQRCASLVSSFPSPRERGYREAVRIVGEPAQDPAVLVGALEIGAIGYYTRARILDHFGLVSPEIPALGTAAAIERCRPDFYIGQPVLFWFLGFPQTPEFVREYIVAGHVSYPGAPDTLIYMRRDFLSQRSLARPECP